MSMKHKSILTTLLALVLGACALILPAAATEADWNPDIAIPVTVEVTGSLPKTADTFQILLERPTGSDYPMPAGAAGDSCALAITPTGQPGAAKRTGTGSLGLSFSRRGVFTYTIRQQSLGNEDCYQDTRVYRLTVTVTNDEAQGGLQASVATCLLSENGQPSGEKQSGLLFENRYANPVRVTLTAIKTMNNRTPMEAYTFQLEPVRPAGEAITVKNSGKEIVFTPLTFSESGTYIYEMTEIPGTKRSITYDKSVYTATVVVSKDENGDYQAAVSYRKGSKTYTGTPRFANKSNPGNPASGDRFPMRLWLMLMALSLAGIAVLAAGFIKKRKGNPHRGQNPKQDA